MKCKFLQFKKDFKIAELLLKYPFLFTLETVLKWRRKQTKETSKVYMRKSNQTCIKKGGECCV